MSWRHAEGGDANDGRRTNTGTRSGFALREPPGKIFGPVSGLASAHRSAIPGGLPMPATWTSPAQWRVTADGTARLPLRGQRRPYPKAHRLPVSSLGDWPQDTRTNATLTGSPGGWQRDTWPRAGCNRVISCDIRLFPRCLPWVQPSAIWASRWSVSKLRASYRQASRKLTFCCLSYCFKCCLRRRDSVNNLLTGAISHAYVRPANRWNLRVAGGGLGKFARCGSGFAKGRHVFPRLAIRRPAPVGRKGHHGENVNDQVPACWSCAV